MPRCARRSIKRLGLDSVKRHHHLELLAPARDAAIGIEAINHGADAVYIGGPAFGARDKAGNSLADIERLTAHAHRFGARIFITLNTILRGDELPAARQLAWDVWRAGADALEAARRQAWQPWPRAQPVEPPVAYPEDTLSCLANVYNSRAAAFYAKHGVKLVGAAYESHEELGEVSLMITKHCVRWSLSLCPKQAKGVIDVQGTVRAEPMTLLHGNDRLTLRFDCKPCEMHVVGALRKNVLRDVATEAAREAKAVPMQFYRTRPATAGARAR